MRHKTMIALGRLVLSKRERVIALEPYGKGLPPSIPTTPATPPWWCSKRTRWAGFALHPLVAPHKRTSRYRATERGSVAEANRATLELEPLPGGAVSAPRRQFNKKRSGSWMCGNGRSVKTRHQKWSSETGGRHDASMAEFRTRRPRHICKPRGAARFLSDLHMCRVGDGLAGWACRIRTSESVLEPPIWICVTISPEGGASPAAETLRVPAAWTFIWETLETGLRGWAGRWGIGAGRCG